jgi:hypothetical protein
MNKDLLPFPWDKFGVAIPQGERNIIKRANLDWTVEKGKIRGLVAGQDVTVPDGFIIARMPQREFLDTCGIRYKPSQNAEIFRYWKTFLSYSKLTIDFAGTAHNSRWVWALAKTKYGFSVGSGKDRVEAYILLAHPHFCGEAMRPNIVLLRTANMTTYAERIATGKVMRVIPDDLWNDQQIAESRAILTQAKTMIHDVEMKMAALVDKTINEDQAKRFFLRCTYTEEQIARFLQTPESVLRMMDFFRRGPGHNLPTSMNSWWGAYQAACYYIDHHIGRDPETRFFSATLGTRAEDKRNALDIAYKTIQ